jgi:hypothetical protein
MAADTIRLSGIPLWRSLLAALISLALIASLLHRCCCFDGDETAVTVSVAQTGSGDPGKTSDPGQTSPCSAGAHCCHCLAHVTTVTPQNNIATIEYVTRLDRVVAAPALDSVDLDSPFKPPRA